MHYTPTRSRARLASLPALHESDSYLVSSVHGLGALCITCGDDVVIRHVKPVRVSTTTNKAGGEPFTGE